MKLTRKFIREACLPVKIYSYLINIASTLENVFQDEIVLSKIQEATLNNMLKDYPLVKDLFIKEGLIEEDRNPFKKNISREEYHNLNSELYKVLGDRGMCIATDTCNSIMIGEKPDLYKRAFYAFSGYEVLLHPTKYGGTVIELRKK